MITKNIENQSFETVCLHGGFVGDNNRQHNTPISVTSTFYYDNTDQGKALFEGNEQGYIYSRCGNPNTVEVEEKLAALEICGLKNIQAKAIIHSSGLAAHTTLFLTILKPGDKILINLPLYGGVQDLIYKILSQHEIKYEIIDLNDTEKLETMLKEDKTIKLIHLETPCNPVTNCVDLENLCKTIQKFPGMKVSVDSTFASPYLQQPFKYGVDFVVHSTTKFLNGHGTALGGVLIGKDLQFMNSQALISQRYMGNVSNGFDCFMLNQGLKTLAIRMDRHCQNAQKVAQYLERHSKVEKIWFLGLKSHPSHEIAKKQMKQFGSMISFVIKGGYTAATKFMDKLKICTRAVSLGTVDTLICHPASTTHKCISEQMRQEQGICDGFIRVSIGIENCQDIIDDFKQALEE